MRASDHNPVIEIDCPVDVDDVEVGGRVRVLIQKCPHCGEWTAGPLGDDDRYFCCGEAMDPFVEAAGELEIEGEVARKAGGGADLKRMVETLTPEDRKKLRDLWMAGQDWVEEAEALLLAREAEARE
ncbi:MAG TPA: hypothetical protein VGN26_01110 [Armatimonadota bacterium]|jgi:hypothetical protein